MLIQSWNLKLGRPKEISKELMTNEFMIGVVWRGMVSYGVVVVVAAAAAVVSPRCLGL